MENYCIEVPPKSSFQEQIKQCEKEIETRYQSNNKMLEKSRTTETFFQNIQNRIKNMLLKGFTKIKNFLQNSNNKKFIFEK